jgi:hypothetical protein
MKNQLLKHAFVIAFVLALMVSLPVFAATASSPTSGNGITPYIVDEPGPGGNVTCEQLGYELSSARVNYEDGSFDATFPAGIEVSTDGKYVSWASSFGIGAVIVKGSNNANVYEYFPQSKGDYGLASPVNASGNPADLSNLTFCWNPEPNPGEWCSPGYWRQTHHLDSWEATGYSPDDSFKAIFGYAPKLSKQGQAAGATANPTLWQVLQSPQYYGGEAFNLVGDLLSTAHPDVNFTGERIEDSCPLN